MSKWRDDWEKPRTKGQHLTEAEIAEIKRAYLAGERSRDVARRLQCSSRVASKYFGFFRAEGCVPTMKPTAKKITLPDRFYKSDFEV
jgi:hypothetical protein